MRDDRRQSNASVQSPSVTPDQRWFIYKEEKEDEIIHHEEGSLAENPWQKVEDGEVRSGVPVFSLSLRSATGFEYLVGWQVDRYHSYCSCINIFRF